MNTYNKNKRIAWKHFEKNGYAEHKGMVLHHIDVNMKQNDPDRYAEWRIEDVVPMDIRSHRALHMKLQMNDNQTVRTKEHNEKIAEGLNNSDVRGKMIKIHREAVSEDTQLFKSLADAARYIGCSRQMVSQCLRPNTNNKKAMGYTIEIID